MSNLTVKSEILLGVFTLCFATLLFVYFSSPLFNNQTFAPLLGLGFALLLLLGSFLTGKGIVEFRRGKIRIITVLLLLILFFFSLPFAVYMNLALGVTTTIEGNTVIVFPYGLIGTLPLMLNFMILVSIIISRSLYKRNSMV